MLGVIGLRLRRISNELLTAGCSTVVASDLKEAHERLDAVRFSGSFICESIMKEKIKPFCSKLQKANPFMPIIVQLLTQNTKTELHLFDSGIDDVVTVKTNYKTVAKRILARLEKHFSISRSEKSITLGRVQIDPENLEVWNRGRLHQTTPGQMKLLLYFIDNFGRTISSRELTETIWSDSAVDPDGKNLAMQVLSIRRLIENNPASPKLIRTVRGRGYRLIPPT